MSTFGYGINSYLRLVQQLTHVFCFMSLISMLSILKVLVDERTYADSILKQLSIGDIP